MYCKNMTKALNGKIKCKITKEYIDYRVDCKNCSELNLVANKGINRVSKNRIFVKKEIYEQVYERDKGKCKLCGNNNIQLHHIIYRSEDKSLINEPNNCIMLCIKCHKLVHSNKHKWQPILKEMIKCGYKRI